MPKLANANYQINSTYQTWSNKVPLILKPQITGTTKQNIPAGGTGVITLHQAQQTLPAPLG